MLVKIGAVFGLATVMLVMLLGQTAFSIRCRKTASCGSGLAIHPGSARLDHHDRIRILCGAVSCAAADLKLATW